MTLDALKDRLPDFAKDIKLNLSSLFLHTERSSLTQTQFFGVALAVAYCLKNKELVTSIQEQYPQAKDENLVLAAKTAATLMAMNNIYYRTVHLSGDKALEAMPANLRMTALNNAYMAKTDFELLALAVSAVNGCGMCIKAHVNQLEDHGISKAAIQSALRIAAVLNAVDTALVI